jgi:GGDEF domain-containing protein
VLTDAAAPHRFPAALLGEHPPVTRVSSIAELEQLGWSAATGELLIIRAPARKSAEFLLAVAGSVNAEFERVLTIACQTLATCLETLATERARSVRERLLRALAESTLRFPAPATALLGELATVVPAVHARLLLREGAGESPRTLAAIGGSPLSLLPSNLPEANSLERPDRIVVPVMPGSGSMAWLDFGASPARKFTPGDAEVVEEAARTFSAWLIGALQSPAHHGSSVAASLAARGFEARVQEEIERARRFSLPVGLLLIAMPDTTNDRHALALAPLLDAVRSQLRGSDLIGRLSTGDIGALLVHTTSHGVMTVAGRVRERLSRLAGRGEIPAAVLGTAAYPAAGETAAALVQAARESLPKDDARRSGSVASGLPVDPGTSPSTFRPAS